MAARTGDSATKRLAAKYGAKLFENPPGITLARMQEKLAQRDAFDQHFARATFEFTSGMARRTVLDARARFLVQIGQFTVTRSHGQLEDCLRAAIEAGVPAREALEAVQLGHVYTGEAAFQPALDVFGRVAAELGVLGELREGQLPLDGHDRDRDLEAERRTWTAEERNDPRSDDLLRKYGWLGVSTGFHHVGTEILNALQQFDQLDPDWAGLWLKFCYQDIYSRSVLDDKMRILCTAGDCIAVGAVGSARLHMGGALSRGWAPREIMEVIFLSGVYFGFPGMSVMLRTFLGVLAERGRLAEVGNPTPPSV